MKRNARKDYAGIRGQLIERGFTIRAWALAESFPVGTVYNSLRGLRHGPRAVAIRAKLAAFLRAA
jgi:hypothetical protein